MLLSEPCKVLVVTFSFAGLVGCGGNGEPIEVALAAVRQVSTAHRADAAPAIEINPTDDPSVANNPMTDPLIELPYPMRTNPFRYVGQDSEKSQTVGTGALNDLRVLGFADVGNPRVMLEIRNEAHSMAVGDSRHGIEVLEISPPHVRLKVANLTWNASMFDDRASK